MKLVVILVLLLMPSISFSRETLILSEGDSWVAPAHGKVWIEDGSIVQITQVGNKYSLKAMRPGQSEIHIGQTVYWISILSRQQNRTWEIIRSSATRTLGMRVESVEGTLHLSGKLYRLEDWETVARSCSHKKCSYQMSAEISPPLQMEAQQSFENKLRAIAAFPYRLEFSDHVTVHLPPKFSQYEKVAELLDPYGIEIVRDTSSLELQPLVKVQITVAEIKRSEARKYGIQWPDSYSAQLLPSTGDLDPLSVTLQAMEQNGIGKVLASPNILCRSGKEAEFLAGGEFPIKIINFKLQDVVWKKYGILLRVKPVADFSGRMSISLETEVSSIDKSQTVDGIPAIFMNRLQSHFDLTSPQTIALSGLLKRETSENSQGLPGLSSIPILGALFSSKDFRDNKTELVILVRPEITHQKGEI